MLSRAGDTRFNISETREAVLKQPLRNFEGTCEMSMYFKKAWLTYLSISQAVEFVG